MGEAQLDALPPDHPRPDREPELPRAFATGYKPHSADMMVYGGGVMTLVGVLATVVRVEPAYLAISLVGSLMALYFWPVLDVRRPQLGADVNGIYVARFGIIPWSRVADMRVEYHALRTMQLGTLIVTPEGPLKDAIGKPDAVPFAERFAARNARWKNGAIRVPLHSLAMPMSDIEARLTALRAAAG